MNQPIAKANQSHHILSKIRFEITSLLQELIYIAAFLRVAQLVNGDNVSSNIGTAFDSSLKSPFYS